MISYKPLWITLAKLNIKSRKELKEIVGISSNISAKLSNNEEISLKTIDKLCTTLKCPIEDVIEILPDQIENE